MANATQTIAGDIVLSGDLAGSTNASFPQLTNTSVTPGVYTNGTITVDAKGRVTGAMNGTATSLVGDLTGSPTSNQLVNVGVTSGVYTNSTITVDAKGRVTSAVTPTLSFSGDVTGTLVGNTLNATLPPTGVTPGTYPTPTVTVDTKGRITQIGSESTLVTLSGSSAIVPVDVTVNSTFFLELVQNCTLSTPTNLRSGRFTFIIKQSGAGNYTMYYGTNYYFATPDHLPHPSGTSIVNCISDGTKLYCTIAKAFL